MGSICSICGKSEEEENSTVPEIGIGSTMDKPSSPSTDVPDKREIGGNVEELQQQSQTSRLLGMVVLACRNLLGQMETYGEPFVRSRFHSTLHSHHVQWMDHRYEWFLPYDQVSDYSAFRNG